MCEPDLVGGGKKKNGVFWRLRGNCMCESSAVVILCTRPVQSQGRTNHSVEGGAGREISAWVAAGGGKVSFLLESAKLQWIITYGYYYIIVRIIYG